MYRGTDEIKENVGKLMKEMLKFKVFVCKETWKKKTTGEVHEKMRGNKKTVRNWCENNWIKFKVLESVDVQTKQGENCG